MSELTIPSYPEDDFIVDTDRPIVLRGDPRLRDKKYFYLYVPWSTLPGNRVRSFLMDAGVSVHALSNPGGKVDCLYFRRVPMAGTSKGSKVDYINTVIKRLVVFGPVQERLVINTTSMCTKQCREANPATPCECVCMMENHGAGNTPRQTDYTITKGDLIIDGKYQIVWKTHTRKYINFAQLVAEADADD